MEVLISFSLFILVYTFILYPLLIQWLAKKRDTVTGNEATDEQLPEITVVMAVYNSKELLSKRVANIFQSNYPINKIKMLIISDGSTDGTELELEFLSDAYKGLKFIHYNKNKGKACAVNRALLNVDTEHLVFCDVRQVFDADAIRKMICTLMNDEVGAVTGNLMIMADDNNPTADPGVYWKYEKWIRDNESRHSSLLGVTGAIYAAKRSLMPKALPENTILDDMYVPLHIVKQGYQVKMVNDAKGFDLPSSTVKEEFVRKVRTLAGNFQLMKLHSWLNNPMNNPIFFQWLSHKVARLLVPYAMIGVLVATSIGEGVIFNGIFIGQWFFYLYTLFGYLAMNRDKQIRFGSVCVSFCSLNIAALFAGWRYVFSPIGNLWQKH